MNEDIRSQITMNKPKVSPRNSALTIEPQANPQQPTPSAQESFHTAEGVDEESKSKQKSHSADAPSSAPVSSLTTKDKERLTPAKKIKQLEAELKQLPTNGKRLAIHLEQNIRKDFKSYCDQQEITPETFLEAGLIILENYPDLKQQIVDKAKERLSLRKRAGLLRRTISLLEEA